MSLSMKSLPTRKSRISSSRISRPISAGSSGRWPWSRASNSGTPFPRPAAAKSCAGSSRPGRAEPISGIPRRWKIRIWKRHEKGRQGVFLPPFYFLGLKLCAAHFQKQWDSWDLCDPCFSSFALKESYREGREETRRWKGNRHRPYCSICRYCIAVRAWSVPGCSLTMRRNVFSASASLFRRTRFSPRASSRSGSFMSAAVPFSSHF